MKPAAIQGQNTHTQNLIEEQMLKSGSVLQSK